jgi:hypothetical protein
MKNKKICKRTLSVKMQIRGGYFCLHLALPTRWLIALAALTGAIFTSMPIEQWLKVLSRLLH